MSAAAGALAVAAAAERALNNTAEGDDNIVVHFCAAKRLAENFAWKCVKLVSDPPLALAPGPRLGIEVVVPLVSGLLEKERAQLPLDERRCFFCQDTVALGDEHIAYLYQEVGAATHLVVIAHCCRAPACQAETATWVAAVRVKPANCRHRCAQCGKADTPAAKFLACGHCLLVNYCAEGCQRAHWSSHWPFCRTVTVTRK